MITDRFQVDGPRMSERARRYLETHPPRSPSADPPPPRRATGRGGLYPLAPARGMLEAVAFCLINALNFSGRASRSEYWYFFLFQMFASLLALAVDIRLYGLTLAEERSGPVGTVTALVLFVPFLAVSWRRLHDTGRSGWWIGGFWLVTLGAVALLVVMALSGADVGQAVALMLLLGLASAVYGLVMLVFLCTRGDAGPNRFG